MTRTDIHRPTTLTTENYEYVGGFDNGIGLPGDSPAGAERGKLRALIAAATTTAYGSGTQCDHCGAAIRYVGVVKHKPTGDHLAVGETCLDNRFGRATVDFQKLRKAAKLDREVQKLRATVQEFRDAHDVDWVALEASENPFVKDVLRRLTTWGSISEKQLTAIVGAVQKDAEKAAQPAPVTAPAPQGKGVAICGRVASKKHQDGFYGPQLKMLVICTTPEGEYKVWGTVPQSIAYDVQVDCMVQFVANVKQADDDVSMAFFSRPRNAEILV